MSISKVEPKFHSLKSISKLVVIFLVISIAFSPIYVMSGMVNADFLTSMQNEYSNVEVFENEIRVEVIEIIYVSLFSVTSILFLIWFYKAYKNLPALKAKELTTSPRWAIIYWFIPFMSLYVPAQLTKEIWVSSDPNMGESDRSSRNQLKTHKLIPIWWGVLLVGLLISVIAYPLFNDSKVISSDVGFVYADIIIAIADSILYVFSIFLVRKISFMQEQKAAKQNQL